MQIAILSINATSGVSYVTFSDAAAAIALRVVILRWRRESWRHFVGGSSLHASMVNGNLSKFRFRQMFLIFK
jgi:uncharacterized protein YhdP